MQLFICFTPLHVLIAQQIIKSSNINNYNFIYFYDFESKKNTYYFNLLKEKANFSIKIIRTKKVFTDFKNIYKTYQQLKLSESLSDVAVYTGNIKAVHTRFLMLLLDYKKLYTFDDGCANIVNSGYYASNEENKLYKLFFSLMAPSLKYENLRNSMIVHYSIFKEKNIYPNVEYINLFSKTKQNNLKPKPNRTILLTSTLSENNIINYDAEVHLYKNIIAHFNVTHIIPHPGENKNKIAANIEIINSNRISEDILFNLSKTHNLTVIGMFSTALLNLSGIGIAKNLISVDFPNSHITKEMIELFTDRGIKCYRYYSSENKDSIIKL